MIYGISNAGTGLGQAQNCGRVNYLMGFQTSPLIIGFPMTRQIKTSNKKFLHSFTST